MLVQDIDFGVVAEKIGNPPMGCDCVFVDLNGKVGLKLFQYSSMRDRAYNNQKDAAEIDLAPEVYGTVDNISFIGKTLCGEREFVCGYLTEVVQVVGSMNGPYKEFEELYNKELKQLENGLSGFNTVFCRDSHAANCGVKNGKLIAIDLY